MALKSIIFDFDIYYLQVNYIIQDNIELNFKVFLIKKQRII